MSEERYTWTYGASEGRTIFINDNSLGDSKGNGIAAIALHRIGKEAGERLAHAWCRALDMLALLQGVLPMIEVEANVRDNAMSHKGAGDQNIYWSEMREAANAIGHEIALAQGREPETCQRTFPDACPHGFLYTRCPECKPLPEQDADNYDYAADDQNFDAARERSWKK